MRPILFLLYSNNLLGVLVKCDTNMNADDTEPDYPTITCQTLVVEIAINSDLTKHNSYLIQNN